ncbi:hypothetical protein C6495_14400 [Candidatus Poribacteria bacterium]|nr:MAG: hypothetical protein C6495_14400 [Candidatus Poribacteria bacterium]
MRFLADENIPAQIVKAISSSGHDVLWIQEIDPAIDDRRVLSHATDGQRTLITFDKDFGELVFLHGEKAPFGIILFRFPPETSLTSQARIVVNVLERRTDWTGHFFSVSDTGQIRPRPLPKGRI